MLPAIEKRREKYYAWWQLRKAGYTNEDVAAILDVHWTEIRSLERISQATPKDRECWLSESGLYPVQIPILRLQPYQHWIFGVVILVEVLRTIWSVYVVNQ